MLKLKLIILMAFMLLGTMYQAQTNKVLSIYWCGFSSGFCGESNSDDVYHQATHVIMAYAEIDNAGGFKTGTFSTSIKNLISQWHSEGKKVLLSIGGIKTNISFAFSNASSLASKIKTVLTNNNLDGVDFEIKSYLQTPQQIISALSTYRSSFGSGKLIFLTCQQIAVYPSNFVKVPGLNDQASYNLMVPVIKGSSNYDFIQVLTYGNEYLVAEAGTSDYIETVYKSWRNQNQNFKISNFSGAPESKLIIGILASFSTDPENSPYYVTSFPLKTAFNNLKNDGFNVKGINIFNSKKDQERDFDISKSAIESLGVQLTEEGQDDNNDGGSSGSDNDSGSGSDNDNDSGSGSGSGNNDGGDEQEEIPGSCYISQCGCPGSFKINWCSEQSKPPSAFCQSSQSQCEGCDGAWCPDSGSDDGSGNGGDDDDDDEPQTGEADPSGPGVCFIGACGCPGSFKETWCNNSNTLSSGWCAESSSNCVACAGFWCNSGDNIIDENQDLDQDGEQGESIDANINAFAVYIFALLMVLQMYV